MTASKDNTASTVQSSGNIYVDGMISGTKWTGPTITFAFPVNSGAYDADYPVNWPQQNFQPFSVGYQRYIRVLLAQIETFTTVHFAETSSVSTATLRFGRFDDPSNGAYAYTPSSSSRGGDTWFANNNNPDPVYGNTTSHAVAHEVGHALGLKHPHDGSIVLPLDRDSNAYTSMSYKQIVNQLSGDYSHNDIDWEQSYMMEDILGLQYLYGANFNFNVDNTVYSFSPLTGHMLINGIDSTPQANTNIFRTIWDGGGSDTFDLRNFSSDQDIDLSPGGWMKFSPSQLAVAVQRGDPSARLTPIFQPGNVANALLYNNDARSLIENVMTGAGNDNIRGNFGANVIAGNGGNDTIDGGEGVDTAVYAGISSS
ncbi:MAG: M10 family metallopeptidase, partial [Alphaproteobacteria bacterium]